MGPFIGRESELAFLESIWDGTGQRTCKVVGRRRIGKSELLRRFAEGRRSVYIGSVLGSVSDNIHTIIAAMNELDGGNRKDPPFLSDALNELLDVCRAERTLVVIDELPYLIASSEQVASVLQHFVDSMSRDTGSMLVVCGSSIRMMDQETTDYSRPLYGRFANELKVRGLPLTACRSFHPRMSDLDMVKLYLTIGGIPQFHLDSETDTYRGYVEKHFLSDYADMKDEAEALVGSEFAPAGRYMAVVNAISDGATSLKTISERTKIQKTTCSRCIEELERVGIIEAVHPMFGSPKHPVYRVLDPMVAFCQDVVREAGVFVLRDPSDTYDAVSERISTFLGGRFEDLCRRFVIDNFKCVEIGKWWGLDKEKETREVDIASKVLIDGNPVALLGECKFRTGKMYEDALNRLVESSGSIGTDLPKRFILMSISGFGDGLRDEAAEKGVMLVGLEEIANWRVRTA